MNQEEWKNYKRNCIDYAWYWPTREWVQELLNFPFIKFLSKQKWGKNFYRIYLKIRFFIAKKPVFGLVEYLVTSHCTLNCLHCNTRIPEFTNKTHYKIASFEDFQKDVDKLLAATDFINIFGFVGGEPLLAKDLAKMIEYVANKKQIKQIFIATNGTIVPNEGLIQAMKNPKVAVQLSDYSHTKIYRKNVTVKYDEIKKLFIKEKIQFNNFQEKRDAHTWFSLPKVYKDEQNMAVSSNWKNCVQICNIICDGIMIPCTMSVHIFRNLELIDSILNEVVNIRESNSPEELRKKFLEYFSFPYSSFCYYCHFENIQGGLLCGEQLDDTSATAESEGGVNV